MLSNAHLLEVKNLSLRYLSQKTYLFTNLSFTLNEGEILKINGKNGSGKSSLCVALVGLFNSAELTYLGEIIFDNKDIKQLSRFEICSQMAIVFQNSYDTIFLPTVVDEMAFALENLCVPSSEINTRIDDALALMEITKLKYKPIKELSSGQLQKVSIASSISLKPRILILDEVSSTLDKESACKLDGVLCGLVAQGMAIIVVDHNDFCSEHAGKNIELSR